MTQNKLLDQQDRGTDIDAERSIDPSRSDRQDVLVLVLVLVLVVGGVVEKYIDCPQ
jgi:hypothetical protein